LAPRISAARPGVMLFRRYLTASALTRSPWTLLECVQRAGRINARRSPDELDHLLQLDGGELGHNLVGAAFMQHQNSGDDGFGHALSGGPAHIVSIKKNAKTIRHRTGIYSKSAQIRMGR
jgi:hypothetical protein